MLHPIVPEISRLHAQFVYKLVNTEKGQWWTFNDLHFEHGHCDEISPIPVMVPVNLRSENGKFSLARSLRQSIMNNMMTRNNLFSGTSSPSNLILNLIPTVNSFLIVSKYFLTPTMNWLVLVYVSSMTAGINHIENAQKSNRINVLSDSKY